MRIGRNLKFVLFPAGIAVASSLNCVQVERYDDPGLQPAPYSEYATARPTSPAPQARPSPAPYRRPNRLPAWLPPRGRISPRWTTIVLHHSATDRGSAAEFDEFHRNKGWDELGYHFVIGNGTNTPDGWVEVGPRWHKQKHGAHCKTSGNYFNEHGIGICLVGDFTRTSPTPKQLASLNELLRFLTHACGITPGQITTHAAVTKKTSCPGHRFSLSAVRRSLMFPATASSMP